MGYYTHYEFYVKGAGTDTVTPEKEQEIITALREQCEDANYALREDGYAEQECKWYDSDEDIRKFSKQYPGLILVLQGHGEENGFHDPDIWIKYFKNGKMQEAYAQVEFDDYDEAKLV